MSRGKHLTKYLFEGYRSSRSHHLSPPPKKPRRLQEVVVIARYIRARWASIGKAVLLKPPCYMVRRLEEREPRLEMGRATKAPNRSLRFCAVSPNGAEFGSTNTKSRRVSSRKSMREASHPSYPTFMVPRTNAIHNMDTRHPTSDKERSARLQNQNRRRRRRRRRLLLQAAEDRIHHFEPDQRGWLGRVLLEDTVRE